MKTLKYKNEIIKIEHTSSALLPDIHMAEQELNNKNKLEVEFRDGCFNINTLTQTICVFNLNAEEISVISISDMRNASGNYSGVAYNINESCNHKFFVGV